MEVTPVYPLPRVPVLFLTLFTKIRSNRVLTLILFVAACMLIGAAVFSATDKVGFGTGLYWAVTTATTVGYGDVIPHNGASQLVAALVMLTTIPAAGAIFSFLAGASALSAFRRLLGMDVKLPDGAYTVIFGEHPAVGRIATDLVRDGDQVLVVASEKPDHLPPEAVFLQGDTDSEITIKQAHLERAKNALIANTADADVLLTAIAVHALAPDLEVFALSESVNVSQALKDLGMDHTISTNRLVGHTVAKHLQTPAAGDLMLKLVNSSSFTMQERAIADHEIGHPLSELRAIPGVLVMGLNRQGRAELGVEQDVVCQEGDRLLLFAPVAQAAH